MVSLFHFEDQILNFLIPAFAQPQIFNYINSDSVKFQRVQCYPKYFIPQLTYKIYLVAAS